MKALKFSEAQIAVPDLVRVGYSDRRRRGDDVPSDDIVDLSAFRRR